MKTVIFTEKHNFGGRPFAIGDKLVAEDKNADFLVARGVAEIEVIDDDQKVSKRGRGKAS